MSLIIAQCPPRALSETSTWPGGKSSDQLFFGQYSSPPPPFATSSTLTGFDVSVTVGDGDLESSGNWPSSMKFYVCNNNSVSGTLT